MNLIIQVRTLCRTFHHLPSERGSIHHHNTKGAFFALPKNIRARLKIILFIYESERSISSMQLTVYKNRFFCEQGDRIDRTQCYTERMLGWSLNYILVEKVRRLSVTSCSAERFSITFMYVLLDLSKDVFSKQLISLIIALCLKLILFEVLRIKISNSQNSLFFLRFSAILL